jgi:Transcription-repair coupling factor (superfamily II helicase)
MVNKQKNAFLCGGSVGGLTEDALLIFLIDVFRSQGQKRVLFLSESDRLNKRICRGSRWFGEGLVFYLEKDIKKTVFGFASQYNRHRSSAIIKIATRKSICCLSTTQASKKPDINKKTKPVVFEIRVGDVIDRDIFIKTVLDLGYSKVVEVFRPGDTSVRGGIVDIFPIYEKRTCSN